MAILNFSVCKGHAWFWSCCLCWRAASAHCCNAFSRKIGLWRAVLGHVFSYNVLRQKIYPTLPRPRMYVHYRLSIISARPAGLPNPRDHGSLSQNRPRMSVNSLWLYKKKHFYTWCAGLIVHALLTVYMYTVLLIYAQERPFMHLTVCCWFLISSGWRGGGGGTVGSQWGRSEEAELEGGNKRGGGGE